MYNKRGAPFAPLRLDSIVNQHTFSTLVYPSFFVVLKKLLNIRMPPGEKLIYSTFTLPIDTASIAGYAATTGKPLNIPNVYKIDPAAPYQFSRGFDESSGYESKSMIAVPLKTARGDILGILQIMKQHTFLGARLNILRAIQERYQG